MILIAQIILLISFNYLQNIDLLASLPSFSILFLSTLCITAGGYVINDYFDVTADKINKPKEVYLTRTITKKNGFLYYTFLTTMGLILAIIVCFKLRLPYYTLIFFIIVALLFLYSFYLQKIAILGNLLTSILIGISLYIVYIFYSNKLALKDIEAIFKIIVLLSILLNFIREIIKDIQDINGDYSAGYKTLPIVIGTNRATLICVFLILALIFNTALFAFVTLRDSYIPMFVMLFGIAVPLGYIAFRCWNIEQSKDYKIISRLIKLVMLIGIFTIPLIIYFYKNA